jgi:signal transduction histidine kinase
MMALPRTWDRLKGRELIVGPALTLGVLGLIEGTNSLFFTIPNPAVLYMTAVVFAAYNGGLGAGLLSASFTLIYAAVFFSNPGHLLHYTPDNLMRVAILGVSTPAMVLMVGVLRRRVVRASILQLERDRAETANRVKSTFVANMSHELRTPLNAILGFGEMLERGYFGTLNAKQLEYINDIRQSAAHQLALVNDLLDLGQMEAGLMPLHEERVLVRDELDASLKLIEKNAAAARLTVAVDTPIDIVLHGDRRRVRQIFINLLSNAVKFTPAGGSVTVCTKRSPGDGLVVTVANTGPAMSDADIEHALQPYQRVNSLISHEREGTGLGLPISKSLAELHGGSMEISSRNGEGTTVTVRFPPERVRAP